jgi:hypothetical protein
VLQTSFDHLASQLTGILMNGWVRHEFIFARAFGFDLLSNVFVVASKPFVRHMFDAHSQLLLLSYRAGRRASPRHLSSMVKQLLSPGAARLSNRAKLGSLKSVLENGIRKAVASMTQKRVLDLDCNREQVGGESLARPKETAPA